MNIKILAFLLLLLPGASYAAVDMFLDIDNVQGESSDDAHAGEIDILAWSWGTYFNGRCTAIQDVSFTKYVDLSSPTLLMGQMMGQVYEKAILTVRKAGNTPVEYITIEFRNVYVSSISTGGSGGEDRLTENMSLNFESAEFAYTPQDDQGNLLTPIKAEIYAGRSCR